ncbi:secreted RxLR effector protein 161-like [Beta vulgaris subsp. vulgaris]|uniref:secreted RxLR effector protein 161-like n=1 Tax=Beta vulgaris subsp. vulgaris TaxID=3555 RepID=UPI0025473A4E|nr:secreted RxLR effector protein 161-like [Beta vulgaris subsp. vulgaris]
MYLASHTRPDISFPVNLLARFSSCPTRRHWNGIKHVLRYLQGTKDMGLFFSNQPKEDLIGFADAGYLSDPHNARSQTGYVFTSGGTAISWRSMKQTIAATSSNHAEILAIHEASRECVWLRSVIQHIREDCGISIGKEAPTVMYEDNAACIAQLKEGYIKGDRTKHILPKFSSPMNCRRMVMYRFYRFVQVKIWQTYYQGTSHRYFQEISLPYWITSSQRSQVM